MIKLKVCESEFSCNLNFEKLKTLKIVSSKWISGYVYIRMQPMPKNINIATDCTVHEVPMESRLETKNAQWH